MHIPQLCCWKKPNVRHGAWYATATRCIWSNRKFIVADERVRPVISAPVCMFWLWCNDRGKTPRRRRRPDLQADRHRRRPRRQHQIRRLWRSVCDVATNEPFWGHRLQDQHIHYPPSIRTFDCLLLLLSLQISSREWWRENRRRKCQRRLCSTEHASCHINMRTV